MSNYFYISYRTILYNHLGAIEKSVALFFYPKGGFLFDFSYRRKAQCGTDNRCRTWGKGKERRIS
ncbi:hypothetical protein ABFQ27_19145, partial [Clostridioides difficile]